ncbi:MAG TPA: MMPL family transporter [Methylomirabilota bacterium]
MIAFLLRRCRVALVVLLAVTVLLGWAALTLRIDPGVESMIPSGPGDLDRLHRFQARFGSDEIVVVAFHGDRLFTRDSLERLDALTRRIAGMPHVARVLSPTSVRDLDGDELGPVPVYPYAEVMAGKWPAEALGQRLGSHPIFGGLLVAKDARTAAVIVEVEEGPGDADWRSGLVADLRRSSEAAGVGPAAFVAGIPVEKVDVAHYIARDQTIFVPLVFLVLAVMTALLYRHPVGILVPLATVTLTLVWTLGLFRLAGRALNPVTSLMTPVILVMSLEGTVQLLNQYLIARAQGLPSASALGRAHQRMRTPCFNAALTAAIGFVSLVVLPIPPIREFGLFTALGIMIGCGHTIVLTPLLLASLPDLPPRVIRAFEPGPVERWLGGVVGWVTRHRLATALVAGALLATAVAGLARIHVETDLIRSLRHASPLAAATRFIDANLTGVNAVEILVSTPKEPDAGVLDKVARLEAAVGALPDVRKVTALPDLLARVNRAMHRGNDAYARLPDGPDADTDIGDFIDALRERAPMDLERFLASGPDGGATLRINARVPALDSARSQALFARIREAAERVGLADVDLTGNFVALSDMSTTLVRHQVQGLAVALVLILGVMAVQFRSIRLGALCAIPNGAPVLMVYGLMGWTGIALSVPTAMIASVVIGTIVDNSIYLLAPFREAFRQEADYVMALMDMVRASGRAVVFSTVTLAMGFWVGIFSSFVPTVHFAILAGAAFLLGLVGQFVLLPLVLVVLKPLGRPAASLAASRAGLVVLLVGTAVVLGLAARVPAQETGRQIVLKDQYGQVDGPGRHRGQALLLIYGNVDGMRGMKGWEDRIRREIPGTLVILRGLDARSARGQKTETEVNERLQQNVPPDIALLIDWNGDLVRDYRLPGADVSVTVVDAKGRGCRSFAGRVNKEAFAELRELFVRVRRAGACP